MPSTRDEVVRYIRFQLSELRARNDHHGFEHLCRKLAQLRIASNIIPATGPVGAGGDQGLDFETFRSHLARETPPRSVFRGLVSNHDLAFICTLQAGNIQKKIESDLKTIAKSKYKPAEVYAFSEANVAVGLRHRLQARAKDIYGFELQIWDGEAIAEHLADPDAFWIATTYLTIPHEIYPVEDSSADERYKDSFALWQKRDEVIPNLGEFADIKRSVREATFDPKLQPHIPRWITLLRQFMTPQSPEPLQRAAFYEIVVASLRGLRSVEDVESTIPWFFSNVNQLQDPGEIENAQILLAYLLGAHARGETAVGLEDIRKWWNALARRCEELLSEPLTPGERCTVLMRLGYLGLPLEARERPPDGEDLETLFRWWEQLLREIPSVPLFPIDRLADVVPELAPILSVHPRYAALTAALDNLVARRSGRARAATSCRDRAFALKQAGNVLGALAEFHKAKVEWFTGDTLRGTILSLGFIAECYEDLNLYYAAKYHYLGAAWLALNVRPDEPDELAKPMLISAALTTFRMGNWLDFVEWAMVAFRHHVLLALDPANLDDHDDLQDLISHLAIVLDSARKLMPADVSSWVTETIDVAALLSIVEQCISIQENPFVETDGARQSDFSCKEFGTPGFSDASLRRVVAFHAIGLDFLIEFEGDYSLVIAAERFIAMLQVVVAEMAGRDMALLRTQVRVKLQRATAGEANVVRGIDGWTVDLVPFNPLTQTPLAREGMVDTLGSVLTVIEEASLLPEETLKAENSRLAEEGITHKVTPGALYDRICETYVPGPRFSNIPRAIAPAPSYDPPATIHPALTWFGGPGPGYSEHRAKEMLESRYRELFRHLGVLPQELAADQTFRDCVARFRAEGWLDWHILGAIFNAAMTYRRTPDLRSIQSKDELPGLLRAVGDLSIGADIPRTVFSEDELRKFRFFHLIAVCDNWGLTVRQDSPSVDTILDFMGARFGYWTDDTPHPEPFNPAGSD